MDGQSASEENGKSAEPAPHVVDYVAEFDSLWNGTTLPERLVIEWKGIPDGLDVVPVDVESHLTPYDWVVSISRYLVSASTIPTFMVVIRDLYSHRMPQAFGPRMRRSLAENFAWMAICDGDDVEQAFEGLVPLRKDHEGDIDHFAQAWIGNLARNDTRHDINNLLGPLLLQGELPPERHKGKAALFDHLQRLGVVPVRVQGPARPWEDAQAMAKQLGRPLRFVFVDDQFNAGWDELMCEALGIGPIRDVAGVRLRANSDNFTCLGRSGKIEMWASTSPQPLLNALKRAIERPLPRQRVDCRLGLELTIGEDGETLGEAQPLELLFLDLRLTSGERGLAELAKGAGDIAERFVEKFPQASCWDVDLATEAERIAEQDVTGPSRGRVADLLTMLPKLVASVDPMLPVVLFSSTGQRSISEELKPFRTIISCFEKPRLLSTFGQDVRSAAIAQWREALFHAKRALMLRIAATRLKGHSGSLALPRLKGPNRARVEIFVDESGTERTSGKGMTIGGLVILGDCVALDRLGLHRGVDQRLNQIIKLEPGAHIEDSKKKRLRQELMGELQTILAGNEQSHLAFCTLRGSSDLSGRVGADWFASAEFAADNLYVDMIKYLLEMVIFHFAPIVLGSTKAADLFVHLPTRIWKSPLTPRSKEDLARLRRDWGIRSVIKRGQWYSYLIDPNAARGIVRGVTELYGTRSDFRPFPKTIRANAINFWKQGKSTAEHADPPGMHYLADVIVGDYLDEQVKVLRDRGFSAEYTPGLRELVGSARLAATGNAGGALAVAARLFDASDLPDVNASPLALLSRRIWEKVQNMPTGEISVALDLINERPA